MSVGIQEKTWAPLSPRERRVLGVMVEKQKTTPDGYPMTVTAITTGCNQKSNRDPVTDYDADLVEETLLGLKAKGATIKVEGSGRVEKWKHNLYELWGLKSRPAEMAILAELMLRGPQTEGELRQRASRMDDISDLDALQGHLKSLIEHGLALYFTPPEQRRGAIVGHNLYPKDELERLKQNVATHARPTEARDEPLPAAERVSVTAELAALKAEVGRLAAAVHLLEQEVAGLKAELGG